MRWRRKAPGAEPKPPRLGRGLLLRGLLAGVIVILATASAVSATVMLQVDDIINIIEREGRAPIEIPEIDRADAGSAQTIMILGSDRRYGDREAGLKPRSDTILLVRLDPDKSVIAVTSVPRDLLVDIPGLGRSKINAAYEAGGERLTVRTVKRLLSTPERKFPVNHVVTVDFTGFIRVIDYIGCVYVDIDRDYFNDQGGPLRLRDDRHRPRLPEAVRPRRARLRPLPPRGQRPGPRRPPAGLPPPDPQPAGHPQAVEPRAQQPQEARPDLRPLLRLGQGPAAEEADLRARQDGLFTSQNPVREVQFRVSDAGDGINLVASAAQLEETVDEFLEARGSARPRRESVPTDAEKVSRAARAKKKKPAAIRGLEEARAEGENQAIVGARRIDFPFYFPTVRTSGSGYVGQAPRTYTVRDELRRKHDAYRLVVARNIVGEYYGVQGTTWRDPPILDDPSETIVRNGRKLRVYRDGRRIRLVAWRTRKAVYWVSNTLTQSISGPQMIGIAASLRRFGKR